MDILFILLGIAIFYAAAAVFAIEHYETNPAQAAVSFVIPPFAWWLYYHRWKSCKRIAFSQIVAFFLFFGGVLLSIGFSDSKIKLLKTQINGVAKEFDSSGYVGSDASLKDLAQAERVSNKLNGRIQGNKFVFNEKTDTAEFDTLGTLRIKRGSDFFGDFEIAIELNELPPLSKTDWVKTIRADSPNSPVIYISWYDNNNQQLRSRKYQGAYNLDLKLTHEEYNMYSGKIQLVLPDPEQSFLVGNLPVFNSRLRFHGEGIDKEYDTVETLEVIANNTLITAYKKYIQSILGFKDTDFDYLSGDGLGRTILYAQDDLNVIREIPLQFYKNDQGWFLDIKGLDEQLKAVDNIVSFAPQNLSQAIPIETVHIGKIKDEKNSNVEVSLKETAELIQTNSDKNQSIGAEQKSADSSSKKVTTPESIENTKKTASKEQAADLKINIVSQEAEIADLLLPLMNKEVELSTQDGHFKTGFYVGVNRKQIVLEVEVGGGMIELLTDFNKVKSLRVLNSNTTKPGMVEFYNPNSL